MHFRFYNTSRSIFMSFPVNIKILLLAFIHSINLKKAGVGQPKYCKQQRLCSRCLDQPLQDIFYFKVFYGVVTIYFDPT